MSKTNNIFLRENLIRSLDRRQSLLTKIRWETKQKVEKIIIKESFYKFLDKVDKIKVFDEERSKIYDYIFCLLNRSVDLKTNKKPSSANITSMYWDNSWSYLSKIKSKKEIIDLMKFLHKEDIPFSSISSMQNWKWIPELDDFKRFIEFLKKENLFEYLSSISWMQHWKGIPDLKILWKLIAEARKKELDLKELSGKQLWVEATLELVKTAYEQKRKLIKFSFFILIFLLKNHLIHWFLLFLVL